MTLTIFDTPKHQARGGTVALTDTKAKNLKPGVKPDGTAAAKPYTVADDKGLYLEVTPSGLSIPIEN